LLFQVLRKLLKNENEEKKKNGAWSCKRVLKEKVPGKENWSGNSHKRKEGG